VWTGVAPLLAVCRDCSAALDRSTKESMDAESRSGMLEVGLKVERGLEVGGHIHENL